VLAATVVVSRGAASLLVVVEGDQAVVLLGEVADKVLALDRVTALGSASTTLMMTVHASMVLISIPTWGLIRRATARVGITSEGDEDDTMSMAAAAGTDPIVRVAIFSGTCHIGHNSEGLQSSSHRLHSNHSSSSRLLNNSRRFNIIPKLIRCCLVRWYRQCQIKLGRGWNSVLGLPLCSSRQQGQML
jgi:hypothetical protein